MSVSLVQSLYVRMISESDVLGALGWGWVQQGPIALKIAPLPEICTSLVSNEQMQLVRGILAEVHAIVELGRYCIRMTGERDHYFIHYSVLFVFHLLTFPGAQAHQTPPPVSTFHPTTDIPYNRPTISFLTFTTYTPINRPIICYITFTTYTTHILHDTIHIQ